MPDHDAPVRGSEATPRDDDRLDDDKLDAEKTSEHPPPNVGEDTGAADG
ncbi:MAG TPA: hypothetical protein VM345_14665 [Acidimicrobiales bacterium]|jgi:hypothetical protein|nr:hypothetical protein [Acidimicrobiales bacterium]